MARVFSIDGRYGTYRYGYGGITVPVPGTARCLGPYIIMVLLQGVWRSRGVMKVVFELLSARSVDQ